MALEFLSCVQSALLSTGYYSIILKVKQVTCLESLFLKKDLVAVLSTGYGKSLFFQVLPRMLSERDSRSMSLFYLELSFFCREYCCCTRNSFRFSVTSVCFAVSFFQSLLCSFCLAAS